MARQRKTLSKAQAKPQASSASTEFVTLAQPDRDGPRINGKTLFEIAQDRQLMQQADQKIAQQQHRVRTPDDDASNDGDSDNGNDQIPTISPTAERILETVLWTISLATLHFTFDVLVQHQYGTEIDWTKVTIRAAQAWAVFLLLFYPLHPHDANETFASSFSKRSQHVLRQVLFFVMSVTSGCYLIHVTNSKGYLFTMKRAPPLGCLWLWAVVELDLAWAALSLMFAAAFLWINGYNIM